MTLFLRLARLLFAEETVSAVFLPAVADFQHELHDASDSRATRFVIRCQWHWALAVLFLVTPLSQMSGGGSLFLLLYVPLFVGAWWCVQEFLVAAILAGVLLACAMRAWNDRHPASVAAPCAFSPPPAFVQINFSSTHVPGDVAGLIFAAGTILIVVVGLPGFWLFFVAATLGSGLVAWQRARYLSRP